MPSIPQSLLWISLVVLWLFVLVPMLTSRRDAVRRTSDVALATRVLTGGSSSRLRKRSGPATGHLSDPDWRPEVDEHDEADTPGETDGGDTPGETERRTASAVVVAAVEADTAAEPDYLDVDIVDENSAALPAAQVEQTPAAKPAEAAEVEARDLEENPEEGSGTGDDEAPESAGEYEYVDDTSGLEAEAEPTMDAGAEPTMDTGAEPTMAPRAELAVDDETEAPMSMAAAASASAERRRNRETRTAAAVSARKYEFRKRTLLTMAVILVLSALLAFTVAPTAWWVCGIAAGATVLYLAYLRRQTRIEEQLRARRARRMARPRPEFDGAERDVEVSPARMRRPGVAVLEIDDEDPAFEDLEYASARGYNWRGDLPRAAGQ